MRFRLLITATILLAASAFSFAQNRVFYAGGAGQERFHDIHRLSNGSWLIAGQARDLDWLPAQVPRELLPATGLTSSSLGNIGFLLQVSADLGTPMRVLHFPAGSARDVFKIRSTEVPGQPTGTLYISGSRDGAAVDGYYLARLIGNGVSAPIIGVEWIYNVRAGGDHKARQPWDVDVDGSVVHALGTPYDPNWAAIEKLGSDGVGVVVEHWHAHWSAAGEWDGTPASSYPNAAVSPLLRSAVVMKVNRRGSLRSTTPADYFHTGVDANGNPGRQGRFPDDYYHSTHCELSGSGTCPNSGPGYTGYRAASAQTQRVGSIVVDRRNGRIFFGYSTKSVLPGGNPDFEPAIVAMAPTGQLLWWDRLYQETAQNSSPDQYVDGLAIDYGRDRLLVMARTHGNNVINFWRGHQIALNPGGNSFQNQFTGTNGNIHLSWLGSYRLGDGRVLAATYVGEYVEGSTNFGAAHPDPHLGGWPNPNSGWPNINTTRCGANAGFSGEIEIGPEGEVAVLCLGRRTITTIDAHQSMPRPNVTPYLTGSWNQFVRVYSTDLSTVRYSSLVTGAWDTATGQGGDNTQLIGLAISPTGVVAVGTHVMDSAATTARGNAMPVANVPSWGRATPLSQTALVADLAGTRLWAADADRLFHDGFEQTR